MLRWPALAFALSGCAPATMSPVVIRMDPGVPDHTSGLLGVRSGPFLSAPLVPGGPSASDAHAFDTHQWSPLAYDLGLTRPVSPRIALHFGGQGAFYYPFPLPAYGLYGGASIYLQRGPFSVAPAIVLRGATDFGIPTFAGPGSILGAEASVTATFRAEERLAVGAVPFFGGHEVWSKSNQNLAYYGGVVLAVQLRSSVDVFEVSGGFGRAGLPGTPSPGWNVPLFGFRGGQ